MTATLHLTNDDSNNPMAIYQGATYVDLTFFYPQDLSGWTPKGEIRDNYLKHGGKLLAAFNFAPLVYGSVTVGNQTVNRTTISPTLSATQTSGLPSTGNHRWVYDIEAVSPLGQVIKIARGKVEVIPEVTA